MKNKKTWVGLIISAVFLYLAFRTSDWSQIWNESRRADLIWFVAATPLMFLSHFLRAVRWRYLLLNTGKPGLHSLFSAVMIGYMSLNLLPLRLGEFIRAYVLGRRESISISGTFATVVVERIFDGFTLLLIMLAALFFMPFQMGDSIMRWVRAFAFVALAIYLGAMIVLCLMKWQTDLVIRMIHLLLGRFSKLEKHAIDIVHSFVKGISAINSLPLLAKTSVLSLLVWLCYVLYYWVTLFAFQEQSGASIGSQVGFDGACFLLVAIALGVMIPSSPGFVGVFEMAAITALTSMGVSRHLSESYAILVHAFQFIPVTLVGIYYLYHYNLTLKDIRAAGARGEEPAEG